VEIEFERRVEMTQGGPRMAPEKVMRRGLRCLPPVRLVVFCFFFNRIFILEYTKKLIKENSHWKYMETGDNYNSVFRTIGEDQAWQDM